MIASYSCFSGWKSGWCSSCNLDVSRAKYVRPRASRNTRWRTAHNTKEYVLTHSTSRHQTGALPVHMCLGEALDCAAMRTLRFCIGDINGENAAQARRRLRYRQDSRRYVNSFPFSCWSKALCPDFVRVVAGSA